MSLTADDVRTWMRAKRREVYRGRPALAPVSPERCTTPIEVSRELHDAILAYLVETADNLGSDILPYDGEIMFLRIPLAVADMGERGNFLRTIADHPDDDVPRLVFADWLDERGDPWGTLIREQVASRSATPLAPRRPEMVESAQVSRS